MLSYESIIAPNHGIHDNSHSISSHIFTHKLCHEEQSQYRIFQSSAENSSFIYRTIIVPRRVTRPTIPSPSSQRPRPPSAAPPPPPPGAAVYDASAPSLTRLLSNLSVVSSPGERYATASPAAAASSYATSASASSPASIALLSPPSMYGGSAMPPPPFAASSASPLIAPIPAPARYSPRPMTTTLSYSSSSSSSSSSNSPAGMQMPPSPHLVHAHTTGGIDGSNYGSSGSSLPPHLSLGGLPGHSSPDASAGTLPSSPFALPSSSSSSSSTSASSPSSSLASSSQPPLASPPPRFTVSSMAGLTGLTGASASAASLGTGRYAAGATPRTAAAGMGLRHVSHA